MDLGRSAQVTSSSRTTSTATANMSVTTTSNPVTYASAAVLADYELTHSEEEFDPSLNVHPAPAQSSHNPADWPTEHRRVPAYRPVNTELDQGQRRVYLNGIERAFVGTMFTGVFLESVSVFAKREAFTGCKHEYTDWNLDGIESVACDGGEVLECRVQAWWRVVMNRDVEMQTPSGKQHGVS